MKIVIIGGGSFSTPNLLKFLDSKGTPKGMELVLASRSRERLAAVKRATHILVRRNLEIRTETTESNNWAKILDGAESVVIQIRVGGFDGRLFDETFPNRYGLCGDEGLGAGGVSAGWRTWPVLASILEEITKFCPRSFVILLTSPLSLLVRASLKHASLNLVGICELPWTTLQELGNSLELQSNEIQADYLGVNHLGWFFNIRSESRDLKDALVDELTAKKKRSSSDCRLLRTESCFPTRYLRLHYEPDMVLVEQASQRTQRAKILSGIQSRSYETYKNGGVNEITSALEERATPWYPQAVGPLLLALQGQQVEIPFYLSGRNGAYVQFLAADDIVECQHHWAQGAILRSPLTVTPPKHVVENLVPFVQFERVATEAIMSHKAALLKEALTLHPWIRDHSALRSIVEEIVTANDSMEMMEARR